MANPEHAAILKEGAEVWNAWRRHVDEERAPFEFKGDIFNRHDFEKAYHEWAVEGTPDVSGATFEDAVLNDVNLSATNLVGVNFSHANLSGADLSGSDARRAKMKGANMAGADASRTLFDGADLSSTQLDGATFRDCVLDGADLTDAHMGRVAYDYEGLGHLAPGYTCFANVDLSNVKGLDSIRHYGGSSLGIDVLFKSGGKLPEAFLRGCGIPETLIVNLQGLVAGIEPIQFYSCFISYSGRDQLFADRLYADLQNKGVRCWLASEDLKIGEKIRIGIDESIRVHDKLLLILSKYSVASDWVEQEVETALERERKEKRMVLFPIRLDNTVMTIDKGWPALIKNTRNIGDFRKWRQPEAYSKAFERLMRDLKAEAAQ